jgi:hypothetical protein
MNGNLLKLCDIDDSEICVREIRVMQVFVVICDFCYMQFLLFICCNFVFNFVNCSFCYLFQGRDRRVELGYQWAVELRKNIIYPPKNKNCKFNPVMDEVETSKDKPAEASATEVTASA